MKVVIDANVFLSALIRDSATRRIIVSYGIEFYFPEPALNRIKKYKDYVLTKSGLSDDDYNKLMAILLKYIALVPEKTIMQKWGDAENIMGAIGPEDIVFAATVLCVKDSVLWANDRYFKRQVTITVFATEDILKVLSDDETRR
ncbi:MAG TPA: PIN domain-containing protein [archaeon]|nr:PIN domain-containing protein [archaeon]